MPCVADGKTAAPGIQGAVAPVACREDAVEEIVSHGDEIEQIDWAPNAHEVARSGARELSGRVGRDGSRRSGGLADAEAADGVPVEIEGEELPDTHFAPSQIRGSLDDSE